MARPSESMRHLRYQIFEKQRRQTAKEHESQERRRPTVSLNSCYPRRLLDWLLQVALLLFYLRYSRHRRPSIKHTKTKHKIYDCVSRIQRCLHRSKLEPLVPLLAAQVYSH